MTVFGFWTYNGNVLRYFPKHVTNLIIKCRSVCVVNYSNQILWLATENNVQLINNVKKKQKKNNIGHRGRGLSNSTDSCNSWENMLSWLSQDGIKPASYANFFPTFFPVKHIFPQPCWVLGPFSKLRLIKRSVMCKLQGQYVHIQIVQRTENIFFSNLTQLLWHKSYRWTWTIMR